VLRFGNSTAQRGNSTPNLIAADRRGLRERLDKKFIAIPKAHSSNDRQTAGEPVMKPEGGAPSQPYGMRRCIKKIEPCTNIAR
jgi:hypothetical protein